MYFKVLIVTRIQNCVHLYKIVHFRRVESFWRKLENKLTLTLDSSKNFNCVFYKFCSYFTPESNGALAVT